tara:strand:- start:123 stop:368 length:246 start_codon:yes stop_codon:yes gene_type:complete
MIIKYFAWIKSITKIEEEIINEKSITDVNSLKKFLQKKYPELQKHLKKNMIRIAINLNYTSKNDKINTDDEVAIFPPVSGG